MITSGSLFRSVIRLVSAGLLSAAFVISSGSSSDARDGRGGGGHRSSQHYGGHYVGHSGGHHGGYNRHHGRSHRAYDHYGFNNYSYLSGALTGFAAYSLLQPYRYPRRYISRSVYVTEPQVTVIRAPATTVQTSSSRRSQTCLQEREYQTRVIVGGNEVDAYGTACLQPDGSWSRGPATLPPQFQ